MRNVLAIARRELGSYFASPLGYVVTWLFLLVNGVFFTGLFGPFATATLQPVVGIIVTILLFVAPVLSMRLLAEEQRSGTLELLLTAPVRDVEVVLGKYLAGLGFLGVMLGLTLLYPAILLVFGNPDRGGLIGSYLAMVLFGAAAIAIGLFASSLSENQIVAWVAGFAILLVLWAVGWLSSMLGSGLLSRVVSYLALYPHFNDLSRGVVDTKDVAYYLSLVVGALFLATRSLEARRWRG